MKTKQNKTKPNAITSQFFPFLLFSFGWGSLGEESLVYWLHYTLGLFNPLSLDWVSCLTHTIARSFKMGLLGVLLKIAINTFHLWKVVFLIMLLGFFQDGDICSISVHAQSMSYDIMAVFPKQPKSFIGDFLFTSLETRSSFGELLNNSCACLSGYKISIPFPALVLFVSCLLW